MLVLVTSVDLAFGHHCDMTVTKNLDRLLAQIEAKFVDGGHIAVPCSTWRFVRWVEGGPPPLRTQEEPWGKQHLTQKQAAHVDTHNRLMSAGLSSLSALSRAGASGTFEHPADAGREPFASIWITSLMLWIIATLQLCLVTFPQCAFRFGVSVRPTRTSGNATKL